MSHFRSRSAKICRPPLAIRGRRLASITLGLLAIGCADPAAPNRMLVDGPSLIGEVDGPSLIKEVEGKLRVFNFQLRAVEDPNIIDDPNIRLSAAHGHLQLKTTLLADGSVRLEYKGKISNPASEMFTGFTLSNSGASRSSVFIALGEVDGISDRRIDPEDATVISAEVAVRLFGTPDTVDDPNLRVVFFTTEHPAGAISGDRALPAMQ